MVLDKYYISNLSSLTWFVKSKWCRIFAFMSSQNVTTSIHLNLKSGFLVADYGASISSFLHFVPSPFLRLLARSIPPTRTLIMGLHWSDIYGGSQQCLGDDGTQSWNGLTTKEKQAVRKTMKKLAEHSSVNGQRIFFR